jgi:hypothetical protein
MMKNPIEMIKEELCERYGLDPEQIRVEVTIWDVETSEQVDEIVKDYSIEGKTYDFLPGRNIDQEDINEMQYVRQADHGTFADKENLMNVRAYTKRGVIKHELVK